MIYVFDTSAFITLFRNYYRKRFPSLWELYEKMIEGGSIVSTREVRREIASPESLVGWVKDNTEIFSTPTAAEGAFVGKIYAVPHFQKNIELKKILKGGTNADPFVIARAAVLKDYKAVVTMETAKKNAVKIPNICDHFKVDCLSLEEFMEAEGWVF